MIIIIHLLTKNNLVCIWFEIFEYCLSEANTIQVTDLITLQSKTNLIWLRLEACFEVSLKELPRLMPFRPLFPCVPWSRGTNNITLK